ncbi:hypothetical protein CANARDRAFT_6487 [[Candida] arabinofermentans NRRL YB-2248]|uniref:Mitochondrial carrier protein n=1 Tax=[Candida] arabinofermentans NRRL YB-2248 TaxID=983967 RepID=A0A1E4T592_9ASCO|nr:hypothetical protein CANARDRAFT_6487 [[Candida] arabinofermentans NRRL YB-2248]
MTPETRSPHIETPIHQPSEESTIYRDDNITISERGVPDGLRLSQQQITSLSGALAGFISGVIVCPLDVAKTRFQAQGSYLRNLTDEKKIQAFEKFKYRGLIHSLQSMYKEEGYRGLYRGLVPITCGYFPTWMIYFSCYEGFKEKYKRIIKDDNISYCASAISAGAISTTLTNPIWVVKTRIMLQMDDGKTIYDRFTNFETKGQAATPGGLKRQYYKGTFDAFVKMYKSEGLLSFYRGLLPSYLGLVHVAIQFPLYENFKRIFKVYPKNVDSYQMDIQQFCKLILASSFSKMLASGVTYPHEILRTRLQIVNSSTKKRAVGMVDTMLSIYRTEGVKGFYSGFIINLTRTVPSSAVTLVLFEYFKTRLQQFT